MYARAAFKPEVNVIFLVCVLMILSCVAPAQQPILDDIAGSIMNMENSIADINIRYEWRVVPPWTREEVGAEMQHQMLETKDGIRHFKLRASVFQVQRTTGRTFPAGPQKWFLEESSVIVPEQGDSWNQLTKESYDGTTYRRLSIDDWPRKNCSGTIDTNVNSYGIITADVNSYGPSLILSPVGFSVFRTVLSNVTDRVPLSAILRETNLVRLHPDVHKVNDFNTVCVDLLQETTKQIVERIYFSVDHGYTPVRYEYVRDPKSGPIEIAGTVDVQSLEKVADGLWFPAAGTISSPDEKRINMFQTTSAIVVNHGLTNEDFNIEFPVGTKVEDHIYNKKYVVKETP